MARSSRPLSVDEVRTVGQGHVHLNADPTYARIFMRRVSPLVTFAVVRYTPLSADAITMFAIIFGVAGGILTAWPSLAGNIVAIVLLQLAYLFDVVDGEVARVRATAGRRGTYLDLIGHFLQNRALYGGATFALIRITDAAWWAIVLGLLAVGFATSFGEQARIQVLGRATGGSHGTDNEMPRVRRTPIGDLYGLYQRVAFLWNYPASMNLFCLALAADCVRFGTTSGVDAFFVPWFAGVFAATLSLKQLVNAVRLASMAEWT